MANASTPQLMDMSLRRGRLSGIKCSRNFRAQKRTAKPVMPPSTKSSKLSVRSWRMRRVLAAPNAWRTAISRPRALARASSRLATLTQLISRTRPTAPKSRMSDWRTLPTRVSARGVRWMVHSALRRIIRRILLLQRCNQGIEAPLRGLRRETRLKARDGLVAQTRAAHRRRAVGKIRPPPTVRYCAARWFGPGRESRRGMTPTI